MSLPKDPDSLITASEFQAVLRCEETTFREMRDAGRLPAPSLYVGKSPRWRAKVIRLWIRSGGGQAVWQPEPAKARNALKPRESQGDVEDG